MFSLGTLLYEMLGKLPFHRICGIDECLSKGADQGGRIRCRPCTELTLKEIVKGHLCFPEETKLSHIAMDLIGRLSNLDTTNRITAEAVLVHHFIWGLPSY